MTWRNKLPNKDPNLLNFLRDLLVAITTSHVWLGSIASMLMTYFINLYDDKHLGIKRQIVECAICGMLALCASSILKMMNAPEEAYVVAGSIVGFLGVNYIKQFAKDVLNKKAGRRREDEDNDL